MRVQEGAEPPFGAGRPDARSEEMERSCPAARLPCGSARGAEACGTPTELQRRLQFLLQRRDDQEHGESIADPALEQRRNAFRAAKLKRRFRTPQLAGTGSIG